MIEYLKLKVLNAALKMTEGKSDQGLIFNPENGAYQQIAEAMYIDGARPSDINSTILDMWRNDNRRKPRILNSWNPTTQVRGLRDEE